MELSASDHFESRVVRTVVVGSIAPLGNKLLADLPEAEASIIESLLERIDLKAREVIAEPGDEVAWIHFPETAVISYVTVVGDGGVESLIVGSEGATGLPILSGARTSFVRVVGQTAGSTRRAAAADILAALPGLPELRRRMALYVQLGFDTLSQSAACNRMHVTEERCARWLLVSRDRAGRDEFGLTQAFLSQMLGVRRPAVTVAIGILARAGYLSHTRGRIRIEDSEGLKRVSCECYEQIRRREEELFERDGSPAS
ncbi:MAG: helix-turn-helix domain-containing protein [Gemmatimonadaceae bacterium]